MNYQPLLRRAILPAAGRGTRLGAITADKPKPMVPVQGIPVMEHILNGLIGVGITEFLVVVGYRGDAIKDYFRGGERWGVSIQYITQDNPNGTGAALALGKDFAGNDSVLASYGDILTDPRHYRLLVDEFSTAPCDAVIGINPVPDPSFGAAVYRAGYRITRVVEKPPKGTSSSNWNIAGINIFGQSVWPALASLTPSKRGEYELTDAISYLIDRGEVLACEMRGFWSDVGTPESLAEAERLFQP